MEIVLCPGFGLSGSQCCVVGEKKASEALYYEPSIYHEESGLSKYSEPESRNLSGCQERYTVRLCSFVRLFYNIFIASKNCRNIHV